MKKSILITSGAALITAAAIAVIVLLPGTKQNTINIRVNGGKSELAKADSQSYANGTIKAQVHAVILAGISRDSAALAGLNYNAPKPPDTGYHRPKYKVSGPIVLSGQSNVTISGDSINSALGKVTQISLSGCTNVHITKMYLTRTGYKSILLVNCKNVTIDSCVFNTVGFGVDAQYGSGIKVINNQFLNRWDLNGWTGGQRSHWVQFEYVSGGGNQINYNRCEDVDGVAQHPHDSFSIWNSNGLPGDSIQVIGNWLRGGQRLAWPNSTSDYGVGITIADASGTYQVVRGNILVNSGFEGILINGFGSKVKIDHNTVYGAPVGQSTTGISIQSRNQIYCGYNKVLWYKANGQLYSSYIQPGFPTPVDWGTNNFKASIGTNILPANIITWK